MKPLNADEKVAGLLKPAAIPYWNSKLGQELVAYVHRNLHFRLAQYMNNVSDLEEVNKRIADGEAKGQDMLLATQIGKDGCEVIYEHPIQKKKGDIETKLARAETAMGLNPKALQEGAPQREEEGEGY